MSVMNYCVNLIFGSLDSSYVTAYGIVYKIQQFVLFAAFGLRDAITPIVSFSYGMQNAKRIREGVRCVLMYTSVLILVYTAAVEILAQPLAGIFSLSAGTMGLCVTGLRVLAAALCSQVQTLPYRACSRPPRAVCSRCSCRCCVS